MSLPSLAPNANTDTKKKARPPSPRGLCERFGLKPGELQHLAGEARRSSAVFAARQGLMEHYPHKFPTEASVVDFITSADPRNRIVREYQNLLREHGWQ